MIAVTGARGRLGTGVIAELTRRNLAHRGWSRPEYDLDEPASATALIERDSPELVIHSAAWTDVDGCAREPAIALRRNAQAVAELARACAQAETRLALVSTNEVFDGRRGDGVGYGEMDEPRPASPYGASKLAGELAARAAFAEAGRADGLWVVRTAWLYGPSGNDFPARILAAADQLDADAELPVVDDEIGTPTYVPELCGALLDLVAVAPAGVYHLVNGGHVSRFGWAAAVLGRCRGPGTRLRPSSLADLSRDSTPPAWGVLATTAAAANGVAMRDWRTALRDDLAQRCPT